MEQTQLEQDIQAIEDQLQKLKLRHSNYRKLITSVSAVGFILCFIVLVLILSDLFILKFEVSNKALHYFAEELQLFVQFAAGLLSVLAFMFLVRRSRETEIQITNTELQILHSQQQQQLTRKQNLLNEYFLRKKDFVESMEKVSERDLKHYPENQDYQLTTLLNYHLVFEFLHPEKQAFDAQRLIQLNSLVQEIQKTLDIISSCIFDTFDNSDVLITTELIDEFNLKANTSLGMIFNENVLPNSFPSADELLNEVNITKFRPFFSSLFDAVDKIGDVAQYSIGHKSDFHTLKGRLPNIFREIHNVRVYFEQSSQEDFENKNIFRVSRLIHMPEPKISPRTKVTSETKQEAIKQRINYIITSALRELWDETVKAKISNKNYLDVSGPRARPSAK